MAEEQVMPQTLVLQNEYEKVLEKLRNMQLNNLTAKQQDKLEMIRSRFPRYFVKLSYSFFGLSENQLKEFNANELKVLDKLISRKARPWAIFQVLFSVIPLIGWIGAGFGFLDGEYKSFYYLWYRKRLKKMIGQGFFSEVFRESCRIDSDKNPKTEESA